ncbi:uncharacterized protein RAG0_14129 [Rhynchosporium agropyri]|uniref:Uncharacterized protein n=1 Tax=Rhynchosporium agropyri TaxID=914238 RepID=A0A1E1LHW1_9HELO|nr:uncharacterized protein RAG0_14129 [Rhynchosporium agropyri]
MAPSYTESNAGMSPECPVHTRPCSITAKLHTNVCTSLPCDLAGYPSLLSRAPWPGHHSGPKGRSAPCALVCTQRSYKTLESPFTRRSKGGKTTSQCIHPLLPANINSSLPSSINPPLGFGSGSGNISININLQHLLYSIATYLGTCRFTSFRLVSSHLISPSAAALRLHRISCYSRSSYHLQATEEERRKEDSSTNELQDSASLHCN